jgi:hypothetical protein
MYWTTAQRSVSGRCRHAGMAPRPVVIFQNSSPSESSWTRFDVQSAGFGLSATAAGLSPLPPAPWQATQLILVISSLISFSASWTVRTTSGSPFRPVRVARDSSGCRTEPEYPPPSPCLFFVDAGPSLRFAESMEPASARNSSRAVATAPGRPASESGTLCHVDGDQGGRHRRRCAFTLEPTEGCIRGRRPTPTADLKLFLARRPPERPGT